MIIGKKILSIILVSLLMFSILSFFWGQPFKVSAQADGYLTGNISDRGVDTNTDGTFNLLEVAVEVNVSISGMLLVEIFGLYDSTYNYIDVWGDNSTYLDVGIHIVYVSLNGPTIYGSGFNPSLVSSIDLYDEYFTPLGSLFDVSLSREYGYTEFDPPPPPLASFTGTIFDRGLDTDGDGAFDYLEVSVEVNVTHSGDYGVQVWGLVTSDSSYIDISGKTTERLDAGIHVVNVSLYGPTIYIQDLNPANVSTIQLFAVQFSPPFMYMNYWLDSLYDVPLSREYLYNEFNSPFKDIEANFVVDPDGRVIMGGALNYTHMEMLSPYPSMRGVASIEKIDTSTNILANFTFLVPEEESSQFPFNSSAFAMFSEYSDGLLTTAINGSTIFPPSIVSEFPFNITDFTVKGEYDGNMVSGNITLDVWNGFPLDDIVIDFQGNNTYIHVNGSTTVIFGNYPAFGEINATILEGLIVNLGDTFEGQDPGSLYDMTNGILEFTMLNNVTTPHNGNATVNFEAKVEGDLILALVNMTGQSISMYDLFDTAWSSIESGSLLLTYAHAIKEADMRLIFVANVTDLIDNAISILPDIMPPDQASFIESLLNTTYCTLNSARISMNYENGQATVTVVATVQDLNAELNYMKSLFLTYNFPSPLTSQLQTINETLMDLTNFGVSINLTETSLKVDLQGFEVMPPLDWINATDFKLERFFNITAIDDYEPPREGEKLKVKVEGSSNSTHTVTVFRPLTVPEPDYSAPGGMTWENQSLSELKDLIFHVGLRDNTPPVIGIPIQAPEIPDDDDDVIVSVNVTDADTGVPLDGVLLSYRTDGATWNNITMSKTTGNTFEGEIPGFPGGTYVEYRIIAHDYASNEVIENKSGAYYVYTVIPEFPTWYVLVFALVLIGVIIVLFRRKLNIMGDSLSELTHKMRASSSLRRLARAKINAHSSMTSLCERILR